jgi:hypothetical protein
VCWVQEVIQFPGAIVSENGFIGSNLLTKLHFSLPFYTLSIGFLGIKRLLCSEVNEKLIVNFIMEDMKLQKLREVVNLIIKNC